MMNLTATTDPDGTVTVDLTDGEYIVTLRRKYFWRTLVIAWILLTLEHLKERKQQARA